MAPLSPNEPVNFSKRRFLQIAAAAPFCLLPRLAQGQAAKEREKSAEELLSPKVLKSIDSGLRYLAGKQVQRGANRGSFQGDGYSGSAAVSAIAGLAFMSEGSTPGVGRFGKEVDACCDYITKCTSRGGYIAAENDVGNMYGHGFATLFLSQVLGMSRKKEIGEKLKLAVNLILSAQNDEGGWRYQPVKSDADLSVTVCQIMALRAARDAGINVPDAAREKCIAYVKKSFSDDGGFRYTLQGGHTTFALTAAGLVSLFSAGIYDGPMIEKGLKFLLRNREAFGSHYYFYGHYYAVQAMWHAGGKWWNDWFPSIRDELVNQQENNGSWNAPYSAEFGTAMACIIMQMPNDRLPIFER